MKFLLVAVNAKYIHSNPGVYSLKKYAESVYGAPDGAGNPGGRCRKGQCLLCVSKNSRTEDSVCIEIAEYTIHFLPEQILEDIYRRKPDAVGFSCYIWNITYVMDLVHDLHKVLPYTDIWLGGPEVSFHGPRLLKQEPEVLGVMKGEGEETFAGLLDCYREMGASVSKIGRISISMQQLPGICCRTDTGEILDQELHPAINMDCIPFLYQELEGFENRILYYESSRGCPFSCSYCLSSIDRSVRFRDWGLVKRELDFFLEQRVTQVKFVDRTFNCNKSHAMRIWEYIQEHDNGVTNFHFEIAADLLDQEELNLIGRMRKGLIQLEIGVQSTNPDTIREIHRKMDLEKVKWAVGQVHARGNVHQHLDLIAGLPYEDYESFHRSFCDVYNMEPDQLQLGFLKVLKGSLMYQNVREYGMVYQEKPPYEVLATRWLPYDDLRRLKGVEDMVEVYYNSGQFIHTLKLLKQEFLDPFVMFEQLAGYYEDMGLKGKNHSRMARYEILHRFMTDRMSVQKSEALEQLEDALVCDCYLRENCKSRPGFALEQKLYKEKIRKLVPNLRCLGTQVHVEVLRCGQIWMFDYRNKDPLTKNASMVRLN